MAELPVFDRLDPDFLYDSYWDGLYWSEELILRVTQSVTEIETISTSYPVTDTVQAFDVLML